MQTGIITGLLKHHRTSKVMEARKEGSAGKTFVIGEFIMITHES